MCVNDKKHLLHRVKISYNKIIHFQVYVFVVVVIVVVVFVFSTLRKFHMFCFVSYKSNKSLKHNLRRDRLINHYCSQKSCQVYI